MGLEFIRTNKGRPWRKGWTAGFDALTELTLFDLTFTGDVRTLTIDRIPGTPCAAGTVLVLTLQPDDSLSASDGHCDVGRAAPPPEILKAIKSASGVAVANVVKVGELGDTFEVSLP